MVARGAESEKRMSTQDLLNWQRLYSWTEQKEPNAVLGESCTNILCPLAVYLNEQTNLEGWSIGPSIKCGDERLEKSEWVKALIVKTDEATGNKRGPVTRERFLVVLGQVKALVKLCDRCHKESDDLYDVTPAALGDITTIHVCDDCYQAEVYELGQDEYILTYR